MRERGHAADRKAHSFGNGGQSGQQSDRFQARLRQPTIADPYGVECARVLGPLRHIEKLRNSDSADDHPAVSQRQSERSHDRVAPYALYSIDIVECELPSAGGANWSVGVVEYWAQNPL